MSTTYQAKTKPQAKDNYQTSDPLLASTNLALAFGGSLVIPPEQPNSDPEIFWESVLGLMKARCSNWNNPVEAVVKNPANWYGDNIHNQLIPPDNGGTVFRFDEPFYFLVREISPRLAKSKVRVDPDKLYQPWTGHWRASYAFLREYAPGQIDRVLVVFSAASVKALTTHPDKVMVQSLLDPVTFELGRVIPKF
jgi:hypothetical protein